MHQWRRWPFADGTFWAISVAIAFLAAPGLVQASDWRVILRSANGPRIEMEMGGMHRELAIVHAWTRTTFRTPQRNPRHAPPVVFSSMLVLDVFDCLHKTMSVESAIYYGGADGNDVVDSFDAPVSASDMVPVAPDTTGEATLKFACGEPL